MLKLILTISMACLISSSAVAQAAFPCDWQARANTIVEPWEDNTATFANGAVRVALLDVIEPASASAYLLILHPPFDESSGGTCTVVGRDDGLGYAAIFFNELETAYDPSVGLVFQVPAVIYLPEQSFQNSAYLKITVNQSTGEVAVTQRLGNE